MRGAQALMQAKSIWAACTLRMPRMSLEGRLSFLSIERRIGSQSSEGGKQFPDLATNFHEGAGSVNRKCHCWYGFFAPSPLYQLLLHETRRRSRPPGFCVSCDFVTIKAKETDIHDCFPCPKSWLFGFAFRCFGDPPRGPGFHPQSKWARIRPGAYLDSVPQVKEEVLLS